MTAAAHPEPSEATQWAALLAAPLLCTVVAAVALPSPRAADDERKSVDRQDLAGIVSTSRPASSHPLHAELGGRLRLVGAELPKEPVHPGSRFEIDTHWEVLKPMDRDWKMFVHIDLQSGRHRVHGDHGPTDDRYPTRLWQPGEFVTDAWKHTLPLDAPPGTYDVFVGFYIDEERMPFSGGDRATHAGENRLKVGSLKVQ